MHAGDHGIRGEHQLAVFWRDQQRRVVAEIKRTGTGERTEMPPDQRELGGERWVRHAASTRHLARSLRDGTIGRFLVALRAFEAGLQAIQPDRRGGTMNGVRSGRRGKLVFCPGQAMLQVADLGGEHVQLGAETPKEFQYQDVAVATHAGSLGHDRVNEHIMPPPEPGEFEHGRASRVNQ
jgi:hypothetical protein